MCGIAGIVRPDGVALDDLGAMADAIEHRGPDSAGYLLFEGEAGARIHRDLPEGETSPLPTVGLAHRRLSIIDLSDHRDQPMLDSSGELALTYNGEIYNYVELRAELESLGRPFVTSGDTEVVLRAYSEWGESCVERFVGMWAFVVLDVRRGVLFVSRDRFGIKPLYTASSGSSTSARRSRPCWPAVRPEPDEAVCARYLFDRGVTRPSAPSSRRRRAARRAQLTIPLERPGVTQPERYWSIRPGRRRARGGRCGFGLLTDR